MCVHVWNRLYFFWGPTTKVENPIKIRSMMSKPFGIHGRVMEAFYRWVLFALIAAGSPFPVLGQPVLTTQPPDIETMPGQTFLINVEFRTMSGTNPTIYRTFQGEKPDKAKPLPGLRFSGDEAIFFGRGITETTQYWFEICNDFGCLQTDTVTVTVISVEPTGPPAPFEDAAELGEGWLRSAWMGDFNIGFFPWIFHAQHSWMFIFDGSTSDDIFLYDLSLEGWLFTSSGVYPSMYSFGRNAWIFYFVGTSGPREFADLGSGEFFSIP